MMIGDPRWRDGGMLASGSGLSGAMWLQPATASTSPAAASAVSTKNACPVIGLPAMPANIVETRILVYAKFQPVCSQRPALSIGLVAIRVGVETGAEGVEQG
jgi:hypothetical protein